MTQSNKPPPRFLLNLLDQLDSCGSDPVILRQEEVPTASKAIFSKLIKQGLFKESTSHTVACISCDGIADVSRSGLQGEKLTAVCGECASVYPVSDIDLIEYRTDWLALANWLAGLFGIKEAPDPISDNSLYIGDITHLAIIREIYIARRLTGKAAEDSYAEISKSLRQNGIVISLSKLPDQPANKRLTASPLATLLHIQGAKVSIATDQLFNGQTHPTKSRAARERWDADPLQKQKEILKANVTKKLATEFAEPLTHDQIYTAIKNKYPAWLTYTDHMGASKKITDRMGRSQIAELLECLSQRHRINGKYHSK